jgi:hypothetical protein
MVRPLSWRNGHQPYVEIGAFQTLYTYMYCRNTDLLLPEVQPGL